MLNALRIVPCGDRSVLVYAGSEIDLQVNQNVHALARALREQAHPALVEITPAYHCLLVEYDPLRLRTEQLEAMISTAAAEASALPPESATVDIPVCYGGDMGPDLGTVAAHTGLPPEEVVRRHHETLYRVYCLGFSPGFPYLGNLDTSLHTPRLADPRVKVPAGSVGIGGSQTGIYPGASPGGWQLIGRTPLRLFDPYRETPALLTPGAEVRFAPIDPARFEQLSRTEPAARHPRPAYADGMSGLRIIQPGMATTVQDLGRRGWQAFGVPVAGAADYWSLMVGNWLLGNRARTSALEITVTGPEVEFSGAVTFCITGAVIPAELIPAGGASPVAVPGWTTVVAGPGDRLRMGTAVAGCRSYLCVAGGIDLPPVLGSLSEDLFGHVGPLGGPVQAGDWLPVGLPLHPPADLAGRSLPADALPNYGGIATVRVTRGPQADAFTDTGLSAFFGGEYLVGAQSDRQGLRLQGPQITHTGRADILSEPVPPGSVQVPANGQPILLMANRQTTGGYTKIATAVYPDLPAAAQLRPGDRLRFEEVTAHEAYSVAWAERRKLAQIRRHLEREITRRPNQIASQAPPLAVQPVPAAEPAEAAPPQPAEVRRFRITIGDVEIDATVEEVTE